MLPAIGGSQRGTTYAPTNQHGGIGSSSQIPLRSIHEIEDWCSLEKTENLVTLVRDNAHLAIAHVDRMGSSVIHWCCKHNARDLLNVLVRRGGDPDAKDHRGRTPLHLAAAFGAKRCVDALLKHGVDHAALTNLGESALTLAQENNQTSVVTILARLGDESLLTASGGMETSSATSTQLESARNAKPQDRGASSLPQSDFHPTAPSTHYQRSAPTHTTTSTTGGAPQSTMLTSATSQPGMSPQTSAVASDPQSTTNSVGTTAARPGIPVANLHPSALEYPRRGNTDGLNSSPQSAVSKRSGTTIVARGVAGTDYQQVSPTASSANPRGKPREGSTAPFAPSEQVRDLIAELMHQNHVLDQQLSSNRTHQVVLCSLCDEDPKQRAAYVCEECKQSNQPFVFCESCWADEHRSKRTRHHRRAPIPVVTSTTNDGTSSIHDGASSVATTAGGGAETKNAVDARAVLMIQQQMLQLLKNLTPQPSMSTATQTTVVSECQPVSNNAEGVTPVDALLLEDRRHERLTPMALSRAQKQQEEAQATQVLRQRLHAMEHQASQLQLMLEEQRGVADSNYLMMAESDERLAVSNEEQLNFQNLIVFSYEMLAWCAMERQLADQQAEADAQAAAQPPQVESVLGEKHLPSQPRMLLVKWYGIEEEEWVFASDVMDSDVVLVYMRRLAALSRTGTATSPDGRSPDGTFGLGIGRTTSPLGQTERDELANQLANLQRLGTAPSRGGTGVGAGQSNGASEDFANEVTPPAARRASGTEHQRLGGILRKDSSQSSIRGNSGVKVANADGSVNVTPTHDAPVHQVRKGPLHEMMPQPPENPPHDLQASPMVEGDSSERLDGRQSDPLSTNHQGKPTFSQANQHPRRNSLPGREEGDGATRSLAFEGGVTPSKEGSPERLRMLQEQYADAKSQREQHEARLKTLKAKQQHRDEEKYRNQVHQEYEMEQDRLMQEQPHLNHPLTNTNDRHAALLLHKLNEEIHNAERDRELYQDFKKNNRREGGQGVAGSPPKSEDPPPQVQGPPVSKEIERGEGQHVVLDHPRADGGPVAITTQDQPQLRPPADEVEPPMDEVEEATPPPPLPLSGPSYIERVVAGTTSPTKKPPTVGRGPDQHSNAMEHSSVSLSQTPDEQGETLQPEVVVPPEVQEGEMPSSKGQVSQKEEPLRSAPSKSESPLPVSEQQASATSNKRVLYDQYFYQHEQEQKKGELQALASKAQEQEELSAPPRDDTAQEKPNEVAPPLNELDAVEETAPIDMKQLAEE